MTSKGNVNVVSSHEEPSQSLEGTEDSRTPPPRNLACPRGTTQLPTGSSWSGSESKMHIISAECMVQSVPTLIIEC